MQALLGALLVKMDRKLEAEVTLRKVIEAAPSFAKPAEDLGYLLVNWGRASDALPFLERATRLDPTLERAWFSLGKALALLGRGKEADAAFEKSFDLSPVRKLMALAGGDKVTFEQTRLKTSAEGIEGGVSLRREKGWQDLCLTCEVQGTRVTRLTWQPLPGANKPL